MSSSPYRKPEWSRPEFERDGLRFLTFRAPSLNRRGHVTLFLPRGYETMADLPMVTLLHGIYGTHWCWAFKGGAHLTAQRLIDAGEIPPICLMMPSDGDWGDGSFYLPHADADYESWIINDVPGAAIEGLDCLSPTSSRYIAGLSMGGFGALRLGAKYADHFKGISGHSSVTHFDELDGAVLDPPEAYGQLQESDKSTRYWLRKHRDDLPPLRFDCGSEDKLIAYNRTLHQDLKNDKIAHVYEEFPGAHTWEYWEEHLTDTLRFFFA